MNKLGEIRKPVEVEHEYIESEAVFVLTSELVMGSRWSCVPVRLI